MDKLVFNYLNFQWEKIRTNNTMKVGLQHAGKWWVSSPNHWNFAAASKAVESVFKVKPDMTREGGSIPVALTFEKATGKNVLLLPMGSSTDAAHSINGGISLVGLPLWSTLLTIDAEKLDRRNYIEGTKLLGAYLHYVAEEPQVEN